MDGVTGAYTTSTATFTTATPAATLSHVLQFLTTAAL